MVILPLLSNCSLVTTVTGAGVVRSLRRMRDPVTTNSSVTPRLSGVGGGALVGMEGAVAFGWSDVVGCVEEGPGSVAGGVVVVCATAIPADKKRIEATGTVVHLGFIIDVSPRSAAKNAAALTIARRAYTPSLQNRKRNYRARGYRVEADASPGRISRPSCQTETSLRVFRMSSRGFAART